MTKMPSCDDKYNTLRYLIKYLKEYDNIEQKSMIILLSNDKYYPKIIEMLKNIRIKNYGDNQCDQSNLNDQPPQYNVINDFNNFNDDNWSNFIK